MKDQGIDHYIGMSASCAYTRLLLENTLVQRITVYCYLSPPPLQMRIQLSEVDQFLIDEALALRSCIHMPFWNALFTSCLMGRGLTSELIAAALFHNGPGDPITYDRDALEAGLLMECAHNGKKNYGLSSKIYDSEGNEWHLPLLDFHCDITSHNEELAALVCSLIMPNGYLLINSGDSYHACGLELITPGDRIHMLGKALLTAPIVDNHYIAHQLQQDVSSIRISKGGKASQEPLVIRAWMPSKE